MLINFYNREGQIRLYLGAWHLHGDCGPCSPLRGSYEQVSDMNGGQVRQQVRLTLDSLRMLLQNIYTHTHTHAHTHARTHTHASTHTCTHTHMHTHVHTHTQERESRNVWLT